MKTSSLRALTFFTGLYVCSLSSLAEDLKINFSGALVVPTCELVIEKSEQTVNLGDYNKKDLSRMEKTPGKAFYIDIVTCATANKVSFVFTGQEAAGLSGMLAIEGDTSGVAIGIENESGKQIKINGDTLQYDVTGGEHKRLPFKAYLQLLKGQDLQAGRFNSVVNFEVAYP
ncbi:Major MR/P fimbria protein precursor [compost metagenome]